MKSLHSCLLSDNIQILMVYECERFYIHEVMDENLKKLIFHQVFTFHKTVNVCIKSLLHKFLNIYTFFYCFVVKNEVL